MSTDTYKDPSVFFLTAPVSSGELLHSISYFVKEVRATADLIKKGQNVRSKRSLWLKDKLRDYFDEYIGKTRSKRKKRVVSRDCRHGEVVKALNEYYSKGGAKIYKGVKTDLWVELSDHVILFEVKTNTSTTSIYQGIGQLSLHAAVFKDLFLNKPIRKVLVLPIDDSDELARCLREMGIKILSYKFCDDGIELSRRRI